MAFSALGLLVLFHVLFASLWFGGAAFQVLVIGRALTTAGPAAGGFTVTLMKRGGIGRYFLVTGGLAILFGAALYGQEMNDGSLDPFTGRGFWLTLGALFAVATYGHGLAVNLPTEKKLIALCNGLKGPPTAEQGTKMGELGQKLGKAGLHSTSLLGIALVAMLLSRVFA